MASDSPADDGLRADLGRLVRQLLEELRSDGNPISMAIQEHLGVDVAELPVHGEELPASSSRTCSSGSMRRWRGRGSGYGCSGWQGRDGASRM